MSKERDSVNIMRGVDRELPPSLPLGEPAFTTDKSEMWVGMGDGTKPKKVVDQEALKRISALETNKRDIATKITRHDLDTSREDSKIKMVNLSDEVREAMSGTSTVLPTLGNEDVTEEKLANNSVTGSKVRPNTLTRKNLDLDIKLTLEIVDLLKHKDFKYVHAVSDSIINYSPNAGNTGINGWSTPYQVKPDMKFIGVQIPLSPPLNGSEPVVEGELLTLELRKGSDYSIFATTTGEFKAYRPNNTLTTFLFSEEINIPSSEVAFYVTVYSKTRKNLGFHPCYDKQLAYTYSESTPDIGCKFTINNGATWGFVHQYQTNYTAYSIGCKFIDKSSYDFVTEHIFTPDCIDTINLKEDSITSSKLSKDAVGGNHIQPKAVSEEHLNFIPYNVNEDGYIVGFPLEVVYSHHRGDSEFIGSSSYAQPTSGIYEQMTRTTGFNQVMFCMYLRDTNNLDTILNVYVSDKFRIDTSIIEPVYTTTLPSSFMMGANVKTLELPYIICPKNYYVIIVAKNEGDVVVPMFPYNSTNLDRHGFLFQFDTVDQTLHHSNVNQNTTEQGYCSPAIRLKSISPEISQLKQEVQELKNIVASLGGNL